MMRAKTPEGRWAWVEVDRGALRRNLKAYRGLLEPRQKICCVIKADAYGHGAAECARVLHSAGADMFAVATVAEGAKLRRAGITDPILVLSEPPITAIPELIESKIMPSVYTMEFALAFGEAAVAAGTVGVYHLAVDTGMNRIGVKYTDVVDFRSSIDFHRGLACGGVFTHFATADEPYGWDYKLQIKRFDEVVAALRAAGYECGVVHCENTPATMLDAEKRYDMVRVGIGLYGLYPCESSRAVLDLEPVMSVRVRVTRCAHPTVGEGVGYGFTYRVPRTRVQICTLPIGYADGLSRVLSNRMDVLYRGMRIHQVGNICMDQCMVAIQQMSIHAAPEAEYGDVMTIMGVDGDAEITADELARLAGTINYEVVCGFGMRLDKVYL